MISLRPSTVTGTALPCPSICADTSTSFNGVVPSSLLRRKRSASAEVPRRMSWRTVWSANSTGASGVPSLRSGAGEAVQAGTQTCACSGAAALPTMSARARIQRCMTASARYQEK